MKWLMQLSAILIGIIFGGVAMAFELTSTAFKHNDAIPSQYSCDSSDISPPLAWKDAPQGTKAYALVMDDPDAPAGVWDHWVLYNIPSTQQLLAADVKIENTNLTAGANSWKKLSYGGPCPPSGVHRYIFTLYALDADLHLPQGLTKNELLTRIKDHILAKTSLIGLYKRK